MRLKQVNPGYPSSFCRLEKGAEVPGIPYRCRRRSNRHRLCGVCRGRAHLFKTEVKDDQFLLLGPAGEFAKGTKTLARNR
jgi:hypothetical protein